MTSDSSKVLQFGLGFNSQRHTKTYGNQPKSPKKCVIDKINPHKRATTSNKSIENKIMGAGAQVRNSTKLHVNTMMQILHRI
jgi:hypothetical protein